MKHAGVAYAEQWWNTSETYWNRDFQYYENNNCANFVSQCLNAGMGYDAWPSAYPGVAHERYSTPYDYKWYSARNALGGYLVSIPWKNANDQYYYMSSNYFGNFRYLVGQYNWSLGGPSPPDNNTGLNNGDLVSYSYNGDGSMDHVVFVVGQYQYDQYKKSDHQKDNYFGDVVDGNTTNRWHIIWHSKWALLQQKHPNARIYAWGLTSSAH